MTNQVLAVLCLGVLGYLLVSSLLLVGCDLGGRAGIARRMGNRRRRLGAPLRHALDPFEMEWPSDSDETPPSAAKHRSSPPGGGCDGPKRVERKLATDEDQEV